jgi:hypothetical protein
MFYRNSRYFNLTELSAPDARGRAANSKALRRLPVVDGRFRHIVDGTDRLDNLAYKYYKKTSLWWHFCDANPEFQSPRALIGKDEYITVELNISWQGLEPPWYEVRNRLLPEPGIEKVLLGNHDRHVPEQQVTDGSFLFAMSDSLLADIESSQLSQQLAPTLDTALQAGGVIVGSAVRLQQVGNEQWRLIDQQSKAAYNLYRQTTDINVFEAIPEYSWSLRLVYNRQNIDLETIMQMIEQLHTPGYSLTLPTEILRVGKPIVIPPLNAGEVY